MIQAIHNWLKEEHFPNKIGEAKEMPDFLIALLGKERTLKITLRNEMTGDVFKTEKTPLYSLEFSAAFPFSVHVGAMKEVASLLHFINGELYMPGFHLDEAEGKILFRHFNFSVSIDKTLVIGITGLILLYMDLYGNVIEEVASGKKTFNQIIEEVVTKAKAQI